MTQSVPPALQLSQLMAGPARAERVDLETGRDFLRSLVATSHHRQRLVLLPAAWFPGKSLTEEGACLGWTSDLPAACLAEVRGWGWSLLGSLNPISLNYLSAFWKQHVFLSLDLLQQT